MCGIFKHKTIRHYKYLSESETSLSNVLNLWSRSKPDNEGRKLSSLQIANGQPGNTNS